MKHDIYHILARHFNKETSKEEEEIVRAFIKGNSLEYQVLQQLWTSKTKIAVQDFDTAAAWNKVQKQTSRTAKVVPMYRRRLFRIAAAAAILLMSVFAVYQYFLPQQNVEMLVEKTQEESKKVALADGSMVWLNRNSSLRYPSQFVKQKREVFLEGEGFFDIERDVNRAFIVQTNNAQTKVLGTSFNILANASQTNVSVATGKVEVSNKAAEKIVLTAGEAAFVKQDKVEKREKLPNVLSWKTGKFTFQNTPIGRVLKDLNAYYIDQFSSENAGNDCTLTATFEQAKIEEIIEIIELTCDVKFSSKGKQFEMQK